MAQTCRIARPAHLSRYSMTAFIVALGGVIFCNRFKAGEGVWRYYPTLRPGLFSVLPPGARRDHGDQWIPSRVDEPGTVCEHAAGIAFREQPALSQVSEARPGAAGVGSLRSKL